MNHYNGKAKLNLRAEHRKALLRNQMIAFINNGKLITTKARVKEVQRLVERLVTLARRQDLTEFNLVRRVRAEIPYDDKAVYKLLKEVAPQYIDRPGGYTRCLGLGKRTSDTATMAILTWI